VEVAAAVEAARRFEWSREQAAAAEVARLDAALPLRQLALPQLDATRLGPAEAGELAEALLAEIAGVGETS